MEFLEIEALMDRLQILFAIVILNLVRPGADRADTGIVQPSLVPAASKWARMLAACRNGSVQQVLNWG
jgi:hypothetical protein